MYIGGFYLNNSYQVHNYHVSIEDPRYIFFPKDETRRLALPKTFNFVSLNVKYFEERKKDGELCSEWQQTFPEFNLTLIFC